MFRNRLLGFKFTPYLNPNELSSREVLTPVTN